MVSPRNLLLTILLASAGLAVGAANATALYDNGGPSSLDTAFNVTSGNYVRDSFTVGDGSTATGVEFVAWDYAPADTLATIDWAILSGSPTPYTTQPVVATGTSSVADTFLYNNLSGFGVYSDSFSIPSTALSSGTYTLVLANAITSSLNGQVDWDANAGPSTAVVHTNFGPFEDYQTSESFQILGTTTAVPEPTSWALLLVGFGGLGGMMRSRRGQGVPRAA